MIHGSLALQTKYVFSLAIKIGAPIIAGDIGYGVRRIIPILGGEVRGEGIRGRSFRFGADFQIIRPNGLTELEAKYAFEIRRRRHRLYREHRHPLRSEATA